MHVRVSRFTGGSPDQVDQQTEGFRSSALPEMQQVDGFKGVIACADRQTGEIVSLTFWESEEALRASEEKANQVREESLTEGQEIAGVERYEVVMYEPPAA